MSTDASHGTNRPDGGSRFATTHWSLVVAAAEQQSREGRTALTTLCETYWYPLYAYARRHGYRVADAQDLTQGFFTVLLEKDYLETADRERGRFRAFLLTALKRFISKEHEHASAQKRGGDVSHLSLDYESGESRYQVEPAHDVTAERIFDRRWALTVLENALAELRQDYEANDKGSLFDALKVFLTGESGTPPQKETAEQLQISEGAVRVAIHRLRQQYRTVIRDQITQTVADPDDVDDEIRSLLKALSHDNS